MMNHAPRQNQSRRTADDQQSEGGIKCNFILQGPGDPEDGSLLRRQKRRRPRDRPKTWRRMRSAERHRQGDRQCNPVGRQNARKPSAKIMVQAFGLPDIVIVHEQNDEAADDEEDVDARMAELERRSKSRCAHRFVHMPRSVVEHDDSRGEAAAGFDAPKLHAFSRLGPHVCFAVM